jgi:glycosyltransferase involved in cell wall biosynthesis
MQILHIYKDYPPILGGIENHLKLLAEGQAVRGHQVTVLVTNPAGAQTLVTLESGVRVVRAGRLATVASTPLTLALPWYLLRQRPDIVHLHLPYPVGDTAQLMLRRGRRTIITYHSDIVRQKSLLRFYAPLLRASLRRADCILATSPRYIETSPFLAPVASKCVVAPYGIDIARFAQADPAQVAAIRAQYGTPLVLFVGQLRYYKGVEFLVRAMAQTPGCAVLIGSETTTRRAQLLDVARAAGVADRIFLVGQKDAELPAFYHAADLFVLPSIERSEAFGIVQIEAMAAGKPVISTELGTGTSYINQNGVTGWVVPPADPDALADAINRLLGDAPMRAQMGRAAQARARAEFTLDIMVERVLRIYSESL